MDRLFGMQVFVRVVEKGSFAAVAEELRLSSTMVGKHIVQLEQRLGARLLQRTTRRQSVTEVGRVFYERCKRVIAEVEAAEDAASDFQRAPRGILRVTAPVTFGAHALVAALDDYLRRYPQVQVELNLNDRVVDLIDEGYEAAVRIGPLKDSNLIARPLMPYSLVVCASPDYIRAHGAPETPAGLARHNCIGFMSSTAENPWGFIQDQGTQSLSVSGNLRVNNGQALRSAALCGMGIIMQPEVLLADDLAGGRLIRLLPDHALPSREMHLVYASHRHVTPKLKSFVDFMVERFRGQPHKELRSSGDRRPREAV